MYRKLFARETDIRRRRPRFDRPRDIFSDRYRNYRRIARMRLYGNIRSTDPGYLREFATDRIRDRLLGDVRGGINYIERWRRRRTRQALEAVMIPRGLGDVVPKIMKRL